MFWHFGTYFWGNFRQLLLPVAELLVRKIVTKNRNASYCESFVRFRKTFSYSWSKLHLVLNVHFINMKIRIFMLYCLYNELYFTCLHFFSIAYEKLLAWRSCGIPHKIDPTKHLRSDDNYAFWLRSRVCDVGIATNPSLDRTDVDVHALSRFLPEEECAK